MTGDRALLLGCVSLASCFLLGYGVWVNSLWPGRGLVYFVPGVLLLTVMGFHLWSRSGRSILLSSKGVAFTQRGRRTQLSWAAIDVFHRPPERKRFKETKVGSGTDVFTVDSLSFPDYDEIVSRLDGALKERFDRYNRTIDMSR